MEEKVSYSIVIPVFNEEECIEKTYERLKNIMDALGEPYELIFVNDGSKDASGAHLRRLCEIDGKVKLINFSRNFGHQIAISAGMDYALGDAIIIIDADLQDPPEVIPGMIKKWKEGFEVVKARRIERKGDSFFKKATAGIFYKIMKNMTSIDIPVEVGDFRLIDRKVCDTLKHIGEKNRYVRGLVSWVGYRQGTVDYARDKRFAGKTKYPLSKMVGLALDGITSFSSKPLVLASYIGFAISGASFLYLLFVMYAKFFTQKTVTGWTSIVAVNLFFNGVVLIIMGIIGEYIGRIYDETKNRPLYIINEKFGFKEDE